MKSEKQIRDEIKRLKEIENDKTMDSFHRKEAVIIRHSLEWVLGE